MKKTKRPISKERVLSICKRINSGVSPSVAVNQEGLANDYLTALCNSGIVFKSIDGKTWQARMRIHDERYQKFLHERKTYTAYLASKRVPTRKKIIVETSKETTRVGFFRRLWMKFFS